MNRIQIKIVKLFALIILVLQPIKAELYLKNYLLEDLSSYEYKKQVLKTLLKQIEEEDNFLTCVILGKSLIELPVEKVLQADLEKVVIVHEDINSSTQCCRFWKKFLVVVHWHEQTSLKLFNDLANILHLKRHNNILVIKNALESDLHKRDIEYFFKLSILFKFSNLVLIFQDFPETLSLKQFQIFPKLSIAKRNLFKREQFLIFPNKIKNLGGAALRTMPDQILPKTAAFIDRNGQVQVKGYVMKFLFLFSKYLNATLQLPLPIIIDKPLELRDIFNLTQSNLIDIPAGLLNCQSPRCWQLMSHIYEINNLCIMVPLEQPNSYQGYLGNTNKYTYLWLYLIIRTLLSVLLVLSSKVWSLRSKLHYPLRMEDFFINAQVVAGMFGGSFKLLRDPPLSMRLIYISLFFFALIHSIITCTRMQTFLTYPFYHRIRTLQDFIPHNIRVLITQYEYYNLLRYYKLPPENVALIFKTVSSSEEFFKHQTSFNTSFAYPVSSSLWLMLDALQNYRNKPLFRLTDICLPYSSLMAFMLPSNSWFLEPLNHFIARVHDMGFAEYWLKTSYIDLVRMKKFYIPQDRVVVKKSMMLGLKDFGYIWKTLFLYYFCGLIVFLGEILCNRLYGRRRL